VASGGAGEFPVSSFQFPVKSKVKARKKAVFYEKGGWWFWVVLSKFDPFYPIFVQLLPSFG
jgi:hypothetical protein